MLFFFFTISNEKIGVVLVFLGVFFFVCLFWGFFIKIIFLSKYVTNELSNFNSNVQYWQTILKYIPNYANNDMF